MMLEINNKRKSGTLQNQRIKKEIKRELGNYLERNENKNKTYQNLWDTTKAVIRGKLEL